MQTAPDSKQHQQHQQQLEISHKYLLVSVKVDPTNYALAVQSYITEEILHEFKGHYSLVYSGKNRLNLKDG